MSPRRAGGQRHRGATDRGAAHRRARRGSRPPHPGDGRPAGRTGRGRPRAGGLPVGAGAGDRGLVRRTGRLGSDDPAIALGGQTRGGDRRMPALQRIPAYGGRQRGGVRRAGAGDRTGPGARSAARAPGGAGRGGAAQRTPAGTSLPTPERVARSAGARGLRAGTGGARDGIRRGAARRLSAGRPGRFARQRRCGA